MTDGTDGQWGGGVGGGDSRSVGAVGVGAAVGGVLAALPRHPAPHLHGDAGLRAPPDGAAELLGAAVCGSTEVTIMTLIPPFFSRDNPPHPII